MADQDHRDPGVPMEDVRVVRWLLAHVEPPSPDAAFVRRLREALVRPSLPAT